MADAAVRTEPRRWLRWADPRILRRLGPLMALLGMCAILTALSDHFLTLENLMNVFRQSAVNVLLAIVSSGPEWQNWQNARVWNTRNPEISFGVIASRCPARKRSNASLPLRTWPAAISASARWGRPMLRLRTAPSCNTPATSTAYPDEASRPAISSTRRTRSMRCVTRNCASAALSGSKKYPST